MIDNDSTRAGRASAQQPGAAGAAANACASRVGLPRLHSSARHGATPAATRPASLALAQARKGPARGQNGPAGAATGPALGVVAAQGLRKPTRLQLSGRGPSSAGHILPGGRCGISLSGSGFAWSTAAVTAIWRRSGGVSPAGSPAGRTGSGVPALQPRTPPATTVGRLLRTVADMGALHA